MPTYARIGKKKRTAAERERHKQLHEAYQKTRTEEQEKGQDNEAIETEQEQTNGAEQRKNKPMGGYGKNRHAGNHNRNNPTKNGKNQKNEGDTEIPD